MTSTPLQASRGPAVPCLTLPYHYWIYGVLAGGGVGWGGAGGGGWVVDWQWQCVLSWADWALYRYGILTRLEWEQPSLPTFPTGT